MSDLDALKKRLKIGTATGTATGTTTNSKSSYLPKLNITSGQSGWTSILFKIFIILLVILLILVFIHFTIKPIFRLENTPNALIPVPFVSASPEGELHWTSEPSLLAENKTILNGQTSYNYTLSVDIHIIDPHIDTSNNRIILARTSTQDITKVGQTSSLLIKLDDNTNDLIVTIFTSNIRKENIIIKNIPFSKPFKLTVVVGETYIEGYLNGKLYNTKSFSTSPTTSVGYILPSPNTNNIQLRNLLLWNKVLSPAQIRAIDTSISSGSDFNIRSLTNVCPSISDAVNNITDEIEVPDILDNLINDNNN
jgi:hypothetical protein